MFDMWEINIDLEKMAKGVEQVDDFAENFKKALTDGLNEFVERIEKKYYEIGASYGIPMSVLGSVRPRIVGDSIEITFGNQVTLFFEYGTGIKGQSNPHPKAPQAGWIYDVNKHGEYGWWYPTTASDPNPYKYVDAQGVLRAWTKGKFSKPVFYKTWLWGTRSINPIIRKHVRRIKV